jgi:hypothetical protein
MRTSPLLITRKAGRVKQILATKLLQKPPFNFFVTTVRANGVHEVRCQHQQPDSFVARSRIYDSVRWTPPNACQTDSVVAQIVAQFRADPAPIRPNCPDQYQRKRLRTFNPISSDTFSRPPVLRHNGAEGYRSLGLYCIGRCKGPDALYSLTESAPFSFDAEPTPSSSVKSQL